jgi:hypothetical protein
MSIVEANNPVDCYIVHNGKVMSIVEADNPVDCYTMER